MMRHFIIAIALASAVSGCATAGTETASDQPSAAVSEAVRPLVGHWRGTVYETAGVLYQGWGNVDIQITDDARWSGTIGPGAGSGIARMRGGWLVLSGTATTPDGRQQPIYYELKGDASRRWGEVASSFWGRDGGRVEHATVSLRRVS